MPSRILKESICTSDSINQLTAAEECLFYRLIVQCDDYGCLDARLAIVRARCYPLRLDTVSDKQIGILLSGLAKAGLVQLYDADGKPYLHLLGWAKHQQIRAQRRKYPQPPEADRRDKDLQADDYSCKQMITDSLVIQSNPIQSTAQETAPNGADASRLKLSNADRAELERHFCEITYLDPPKQATEKERRAAATRWWTPLREIAELADFDIGRAKILLEQALVRLDGRVTIEAPASILKTVRGEVATAKRGDASGRLQPKPPATTPAIYQNPDGTWFMPVGGHDARR